MKNTALSRRYAAALGQHLQGDAGGSMGKRAVELGRAWAAAGISVTEFARIHEAALTALTGASRVIDRESVKRAQEFFVAALKPIEQSSAGLGAGGEVVSATHRVRRLKKSEADLAESERKVRRHTRLRQTSEEALRLKRVRLVMARKETHALEEDLRTLARQTMSAQERERSEFSELLHDEVAQSLIGIKLRLAHLEGKRSDEAEKLLSDIAEARGLVKGSAAKMRAALGRLGGGK